MNVKTLAHLLTRNCYLYMIEIDSEKGDRYPRDILSLSNKEDIHLIEQIGDTWEIDRIEIDETDSNLLYITYRKKD